MTSPQTRTASCLVASVAAFAILTPVDARALDILPDFSGLGANEEALFRAAIDAWERAIPDVFTVTLDIDGAALPGSTLARTSGFTAGADLRPSAARIEVDDRAGDIGWFVDPTPEDGSEYDERHGRLAADPAGPAWLLYDLWTVANHELAHVLGFSVNYARFAEHVGIDADGQRVYRGDDGREVPLAEAGTHLSNLHFPDDLMAEVFSVNQRRLVSSLDLLLLADAFAYTVVLPPDPPDPIPEPPVTWIITIALLAGLCVRRQT
jgi:hypothetical protein